MRLRGLREVQNQKGARGMTITKDSKPWEVLRYSADQMRNIAQGVAKYSESAELLRDIARDMDSIAKKLEQESKE